MVPITEFNKGTESIKWREHFFEGLLLQRNEAPNVWGTNQQSSNENQKGNKIPKSDAESITWKRVLHQKYGTN